MKRKTKSLNLSFEVSKGLIGKIFQQILGFVGIIIFARVLGPASFGGFYLLLSIVKVADQPLNGFASAVEKRFSENNPAEAEVVGSVGFVYLIAFVLVGVAAFLSRGVLASLTGIENAALVGWLLFVSITLFGVSQDLLIAYGYPALSVWNDTGRSVFTLVLQLGFVLAGFGAAGMGYGLTGATLLVIPVAVYVVRTVPELPSREMIKSLWEYARYSIPVAVVTTAYTRLDILLIGYLLTTDLAGQYQVALQLTTPAALVVAPLARAIFPKISAQDSDDMNVEPVVTRALSFSSVLAVPLFFGSVVISEQVVVTLFGAKYRPAAILLIGLAAFRIFRSQSRICMQVIGAIDRPDLNLWLNVGTFLLNVTIGVPLILKMGAGGAVGATVIAELLRYVVSLAIVRREVSGVPIFSRGLSEQVVAGVIMFTTVLLVTQTVTIESWQELVVVVGIGTLVYAGILLGISSTLRATVISVYHDVVR